MVNIARVLFGLDKKKEVSEIKRKEFSRDYSRLNPNLLIPDKSEEE
jgi:DNA transposition AAA+ family ATPase|tara:strand:+ start:437 stop:574 length:138 start_codon:yes stop_codon:yes gene_type:complete